jgi:hypothetical protein
MNVITSITTITTITIIKDDGTTETTTNTETTTETTSTPKAEPKAKATKATPKQAKAEPKEPQKITSYTRFKNVILEAYHKLNEEYNLGNLVHIYRLRREIGDRVSRIEFNNWLLEMQYNDIFQLMAGEMPDITQDKREDSLVIPDIGFRYYAKLL